jgi:23S rRNA (uracil1939-C5)-methyltransferase
VVFVPGGAPGDLVEVRVTDTKRNYGRGELLRVVEPGRRVSPPCALAGECGGCPWMHVESQAQLAAKEQIVRHALAKTGAEVLPIIGSSEWSGYRVRARMTARGGVVGFQTRKSHRVVDVKTCIALDLRLDGALRTARELIGSALGEGGTLGGLVSNDGRVHLSIEGGQGAEPERLADDSAQLIGKAGIEGVVVRAGDMSRYHGARRLTLEGSFQASAEGFAQASASQNEVLRRLVKEWAVPSSEEAPPRVLELYAGDGNFTRDLVRRARVVAVEGDRDAAARLVDNLRASMPRGMGTLDRWNVRAESAGNAVMRLRGEKFDVVVLDPPRAGATEAVFGIADLAAPRIVYVSCDPMTLARDVARLAESGYRALKAQPIDMMPHTSHVEVVCLLEKS